DKGYWVQPNGSTTPSISFELFGVDLVGNEVYDNIFTGNVSIVNLHHYTTPKNRVAIRLYNNLFDNPHGSNYALEVSIHDIEIDHNFFHGGKWGITDWRHTGHRMTAPYENWSIHHNVFFDIQGSMPGLIRSETNGLRNVE